MYHTILYGASCEEAAAVVADEAALVLAAFAGEDELPPVFAGEDEPPPVTQDVSITRAARTAAAGANLRFKSTIFSHTSYVITGESRQIAAYM